MDQVYEYVIFSDVLQDDERFCKIIDEVIESRDVLVFKVYVNELIKK